MNIKRGQIYYANLGEYFGSEQGGKRPVVILQNNIANSNAPTTIIAPLTSVNKKVNMPTHTVINCSALLKKSIVLCEQIKVIDKKRIENFVGTVSDSDMKNIDKCIANSLGVK